jgi:hypothetical protein
MAVNADGRSSTEGTESLHAAYRDVMPLQTKMSANTVGLWLIIRSNKISPTPTFRIRLLHSFNLSYRPIGLGHESGTCINQIKAVVVQPI